jgi:HEAT repeat protein
MKKLSAVGLMFLLAGCNPEPVYQGRAIHVWRQELKHPDPTARWHAAAVFAVVRPPVREVIPDLIECLQDHEHTVRWEAAVALGQMGPDAAEAVPALTRLLDDPVYYVRAAAAEALKKIDPEAASKAEAH